MKPAEKCPSIDDEEFEQMLTSCIVTFDANGGSVDKTEQTVYYGQPYGTLPVPTLQYYKFVGWFTEASFGSLSLQLVKEV